MNQFWLRLQDPAALIISIVLLGLIVLHALYRIHDHLNQINDTLVACLHELEEISREPRERAKLQREIAHTEEVSRHLGNPNSPPGSADRPLT